MGFGAIVGTHGAQWSTWTEILREFDFRVAWEQYESQAAIKAIRNGQRALPREQMFWDIQDAWMGSRQDCIALAEARAGVTYAMVVDGQWFQSDAEGDEPGLEWIKWFHVTLNQLPDTILLTMVDCHV